MILPRPAGQFRRIASPLVDSAQRPGAFFFRLPGIATAIKMRPRFRRRQVKVDGRPPIQLLHMAHALIPGARAVTPTVRGSGADPETCRSFESASLFRLVQEHKSAMFADRPARRRCATKPSGIVATPGKRNGLSDCQVGSAPAGPPFILRPRLPGSGRQRRLCPHRAGSKRSRREQILGSKARSEGGGIAVDYMARLR